MPIKIRDPLTDDKILSSTNDHLNSFIADQINGLFIDEVLKMECSQIADNDVVRGTKSCVVFIKNIKSCEMSLESIRFENWIKYLRTN